MLIHHKHILQIPKNLNSVKSSVALDEFLNGIINRIIPTFTLKTLDKESIFYYKILIFKHTKCITKNNQYNFVFDEKTLDKIL